MGVAVEHQVDTVLVEHWNKHLFNVDLVPVAPRRVGVPVEYGNNPVTVTRVGGLKVIYQPGLLLSGEQVILVVIVLSGVKEDKVDVRYVERVPPLVSGKSEPVEVGVCVVLVVPVAAHQDRFPGQGLELLEPEVHGVFEVVGPTVHHQVTGEQVEQWLLLGHRLDHLLPYLQVVIGLDPRQSLARVTERAELKAAVLRWGIERPLLAEAMCHVPACVVIPTARREPGQFNVTHVHRCAGIAVLSPGRTPVVYPGRGAVPDRRRVTRKVFVGEPGHGYCTVGVVLPG